MEKLVRTRDVGIDLLRMLCMFMVVLLHVVGVAGFLEATDSQPAKFEQLKFLQIASMCAVNCYGLISGYVGWKKQFRLSAITILWLQVFLYSAGLGVLFYLLRPDVVSLKDVIKLCLPVLTERYWYFTAYFALFFTMPLLNAAIHTLSRRQLRDTLLCLLFLLTVCQSTVLVTNAFGTNSGYSYVWLAILYCAGGYLGKYSVSITRPKAAAIYGVCVAVCWGAQFLMGRLGISSPDRLAAYNSPVVFLMGAALLLLFAGMRLPVWAQRAVGILAPASFGVYLVHLHPLIRNHFLLDRFRPLEGCPAWSMIPLALGLALAIYLVCTGIDLLRHWLFRKLKIRQLLDRLCERISSVQIGV